MGQKVHPHGMRVGVIKNWSSTWYADSKDFAKFVIEDNKIRKELKKELYQARISEMIIERTNSEVRVTLHTAKPGLVIGKNGAQLEELKKKLQKELGREISINVVEIRKPDLDSQVVAETVAASLEKRMSFRKAMKQAIQKTRKAGAKGIKIAVSGRLGGAEMARTEFYSEGTVPLQTIRADIDYGFAEADTTYGKLGVKVLIYKGEILGNKKERLYGKRKNEPRRDNRNNNKRNNNTKKVNKGEKEVSENAINAKEN